MEETQIFATDYRTLAAQKLRENFRSVLIGTFSLSLVVSLLYFQAAKSQVFSKNILAQLFTQKFEQSAAIQNIMNKIQHSNLAFSAKPSPASNTLGIAAQEQGQISSVSTQQVTVKGDKYTVQPGDSISSIALQAYGDLNAWPRIAKANKLENPESIEVGMVLIIPR